MYRTVIISLILLSSISLFAQKEKKVKLDYTYYASPSEGIAHAKERAFEEAKIEAIGNEFGTIVSSATSSMIGQKKASDGSAKAIDDFFMLSSTDVRGEWIETTKLPEYDVSVTNNSLVVHVTAEGRIREIVSARVDFHGRVLRNGTQDKFEASEFLSGDDMFVSFVSPVDGYLSVYLLDSQRDAYCLLPYQAETDGAYRITANNRYVLFSQKEEKSPQIKPIVDEMVITADDDIEHNQLYIIFSPNKYSKAADNESALNSDGLQLPRQLSYHQFLRWLEKCRKRDKDMCVEKNFLTIRKRQ